MASDLGQHLATFTAAPLRRSPRIPLLLVGAILYGVAGFLLHLLLSGPHPSASGIVGCGVIVLIGSAFVVPAAVSFTPRARRRHASHRVDLYEHGFVLVNGEANDGVPIRWDSVRELRRSIISHYAHGQHVRTTHRYLVTTADGRTFALTEALRDIATLGAVVDREVTAAQLPAAWERLRSAGRVRFGDLVVTPDTIGYRRRELMPWANVTSVGIDGGNLRIRRQPDRSWLTLEARMVPNVSTFLALAQQLAQGHAATREA